MEREERREAEERKKAMVVVEEENLDVEVDSDEELIVIMEKLREKGERLKICQTLLKKASA